MKDQIPTISDLQDIESKENGESLINLGKLSSEIICRYQRIDSGIKKILVRQSVAYKLQNVQRQLAKHNDKLINANANED